MPRLHWLLVLPAVCFLAAPSQVCAGEGIDPTRAKADPDGSTLWYDLRLLDVEGQGWKDTKAPYDRLPARAEKTVRPAVWGLSRHSAGLCARFVTNATTLRARWTLTSDRLAMPHMPATGVSGLDLYVRAGDGRWRWLGIGRPGGRTTTAQLVGGLPAGKREFLLYLPLYNGVSSVEIGLPKGSTLAKGPPRPAGHDKPIVFYGTSITQGGCASRPGMVHTAILGRRLEWPVINLGFSGNGRMEPAVTSLLAELDAAVYVIDCLPNLGAADVARRTEPLVRSLRKARPQVPILLVEDRSYANAPLLKGPRQHNAANRDALWQAYQKLLASGVGGLHYLPGGRLLGDDGEDTVDSSHPTDLGFMRHADAFEKALKPLLPEPTPPAQRRPIDGYTDQLSYQPGDEVAFHISTTAGKYSLEIARTGGKREVVWKKEGLAGKSYPLPANASSHGCGWPASFKLKLPAELRSGYYTGRMEAALPGGKTARSELFFVVRSAHPGKDTKILLQLCTEIISGKVNSWVYGGGQKRGEQLQ